MNQSNFLRLFLINFFLCLPLSLLAQKDTTYIKTYPSKIFISPFNTYRNFSVQLRPDDVKPKEAILYAPNSSNSIGASFAYKSLAIGGSLAVPPRRFRQKYFGKTKALTFGFNLSQSRHIVELAFRRFSGLTDTHSPIYLDSTQVNDFYIRDDMQSTVFNSAYSFVFLPKKYSYKAAFTFKEKQLKSAGSPMGMTSFSYIKLKADSSFIHPELSDSYQGFETLDFLRSADYGLAPGYAYTFAYDQVFIGMALFAGIKLQHNRYSLDYDSEIFDHRWNATPLLNFKMNLGYNGHRYFGGLAFNSQLNYIRAGSFKGRLRYRTISLRIGMRIEPSDKIKRLEKRLLKYMERDEVE